jgi:hypothetical protein
MMSAVIALGALSMALAPSAQAWDGSPCYYKRDATFQYNGWNYKEQLYTCPLWRGSVPVHKTTNPGSPVVGFLNYGGHANWFIVEAAGARVWLGGATNYWWGSTMADNGRWGWVNEVYFSGGNNDEEDAGLLRWGGSTGWRPIAPWQVPPAYGGVN